MFKLSSIILVVLIYCNALAKSPHGDKLNIRCEVCHSSDGWKFKTEKNLFNHNQTNYPLVGQHVTLDCRQCHADLVFSNAKTSCISCHRDMHEQTVGLDCERCHTPKSWIVQNITEIHRQSRFPLQGQHAQTDCYQCHKSATLLRFNPMGTLCADCHQEDFNSASKPSHVTSKFPEDCFLCHTEKGWQPAKFDHNINTGFPLKGSHFGVACTSCHPGDYKNTATNCAGCHQTEYNKTTNPEHAAAKFSTECKTCHTETAWRPATFNHNTSTNFPLTGGHSGKSCISCHTKGYAGIGSECVSCHQTDFNLTKTPSHSAAKYPTDCKLCHTSVVWIPATFDHNISTTFPLTGSHVGVACISCHASGYTGTSAACVSCHQTNYNATTNPGHLAAKFSTDCKTCHTTTAWKPSSFNHNTATTFPLSGGHTGITCISCHSKGYAGTPNTCVSCHQNDYNATTNPGHVAAKYPTDCKMCHTATAWNTASFDHNISTTFPLTGSHVGVSCISCHASGYTGTSAACVSCHQTNYNATTNPGHLAAKFPTDCKTCHTTTAWKPSSFNHNTATTFPLSGGHTGITCISCHSKGYVGTSTACVSCHQNDYNSTTDPGHVAAKYPTDCKICHTVADWNAATFDHNNTTFPLTGAHAGITCISCHASGYTGTSAVCVSCHQTDYNTTTNPGHVAAKFPTDCKACHTTAAWKPSSFNHNTGTTFPLTGSHVGVACISCHASGYTGTSAACVSCHRTDYNATTNPGHVAAKFSTDCKSCHNMTAWKPSTFNHNTGTTFPLSGAHTGVACINCHSTGYAGTSTVCSSCHLTDYNASTNPAHASAKFPTNCESCHSVTAWTPSTFNHDSQYFRIYSGKHKGRWTLCSECHTTPTNFAVFSCLNCHEHNKTSMDSEHKGTTGYVYNSTNCLACHPRI